MGGKNRSDQRMERILKFKDETHPLDLASTDSGTNICPTFMQMREKMKNSQEKTSIY